MEFRKTKTKVDELFEKQTEAEKRQQRELENLRTCCKEIFKDTNGKYLLKYLKKICFWEDQDMNVNHDTIVYKKGRRDVWLILRSLIPKDVLAQIEIYDAENINE